MQPIDAYCERLGPQFWAEPLNAVSNLAFVCAALVGLWLWRRGGRADRAGLALSIWVAVIGTGSFLFHTFANRWSMFADVIPIAIFIYAYFGLALHRFFGMRWWLAAISTAAFFAGSAGLQPVLSITVGSSAGYIPALAAMFGIGGALAARRKPPAAMLLAAGCVFAVSLAARMADMPLCPSWPSGTHYAWHILNAVTLALLLSGFLKVHPGRRMPR